MRLLSLKDVQLTDAYAGLTAAEKAALASQWTAVPVDGVLSTGLLRSWLVSQTAQGAGWNRGATAGARSVWRAQAVPAVAPSQTSLGSIWRDTRVGAMGARVGELAGRSALQEALADRESPSARAQRIAGTGERAKASDYSVGGRSSGPNPAFANLMPTERRGVTESTIDEFAQQGIGFKLGDRLAERDADRAAWAGELDASAGLGGGVHASTGPGGRLFVEAAEDATEVALRVGVFFFGLVVGAAAGAKEGKSPMAGAIGAAVGASAGLVVGNALVDIHKAQKENGGPDLYDTLLELWNEITSSDRAWVAPTRAEYDAMQRQFLGHLDGTPFAQRRPGALPASRPEVDPRQVRPRSDAEEVGISSAWRRLLPGEGLVTPADPLQVRRRGGVPLTFLGADPRAVDPVDGSEPKPEAPPKPRPSVAGQSK